MQQLRTTHKTTKTVLRILPGAALNRVFCILWKEFKLYLRLEVD